MKTNKVKPENSSTRVDHVYRQYVSSVIPAYTRSDALAESSGTDIFLVVVVENCVLRPECRLLEKLSGKKETPTRMIC
jgi:hypothetical protein